MPRQRHRAFLDGTLLAITALSVMGWLIALGFLRSISRENGPLIILISSVSTVGGLIGLMLVSIFWKRLRKQIWLDAMAIWKLNAHKRVAPKFDMTTPLSDQELRQLAIHIYSRIGYLISNGATNGYLRLINPDGSIEIVAYKQQADPIELHHAYSLELLMKHNKAVRGFFWAPSGFTSEAIDWAEPRFIILADRDGIGRFVDCAFEKGSRLLER